MAYMPKVIIPATASAALERRIAEDIERAPCAPALFRCDTRNSALEAMKIMRSEREWPADAKPSVRSLDRDE